MQDLPSEPECPAGVVPLPSTRKLVRLEALHTARQQQLEQMRLENIVGPLEPKVCPYLSFAL